MNKKTEKAKAKAQAANASLEVVQPTASEAEGTLTIYGNDPYSLTMPENMPESDYLGFGSKIGKAMAFASWRIGDWVNYGKKQYGYKDYEKIAAVSGLANQYLRACSSVAGRVPAEMRSLYSLEKFRLMLSRQDEGEKIEHLVKRLGNKTSEQLREMGASARGAGKGDTNMTATEAWELMKRIHEAITSWDEPKFIVFKGIDSKDNVLTKLRNVLFMLDEEIEKLEEKEENKAKQAKAEKGSVA